MDDILLIQICPEDDEIMNLLLHGDLKLITDTKPKDSIYHRNLNIKPEDTSNGALCLGSLVSLDTTTGLLKIRYQNKNEKAIPEMRQDILRFQHAHSFSPQLQKIGAITTEAVRLERLTSNQGDTIKQMKLLARELRLIGYKTKTIKKALLNGHGQTKDIIFKHMADSICR